ncbi:MAG TPA: hypothetical protein VGM09_19045 [Bradyrhizobium sp.]
MADDRPIEKPEAGPDHAALPPDSGRPRRAPPTIDLEATEISSETRNTGGDAAPEPGPQETGAAASASAEPKSAEVAPEKPEIETPAPEKPSPAISPWVIAPVSGAVAAALVIGVGWMLGWPPAQPATAPQVTSATVDALTARVAGVEAKVAKPAADPAVVARIAALEKASASLHDDLIAARAQSEKLTAQIGSIKSTPGEATAPAVDLSAITARLDAIERASRAEGAEIAQQKLDDAPLRRVVVASLLDLSVRQGEPFAETLSAAKTLAPDAEALKPLEDFASTGVPTASRLSRELLTLVPKLSPPPAQNDAAGSSFVDRLKAGASNLVRIERTDATGTDRGAIVARVTAAALRNDSNEARRELKTLPAADRAAAQSWIDKVDARDAALAASRQFAADAMTALAKPAP